MFLDMQFAKIKKENKTPIKNKIKHIVISGGGTVGFSYLGVLSQSHKMGWWNINDIKSIYATSAGTLCGLLIVLNLDWDIILEYFKSRPWELLFTLKGNILSYFYRKGILGKNVIDEMFEPFFRMKEYSQDITMKELYDDTGIDFHCFITDFTSFELLNVSHTTHPNWKLMDVIYASCCVPVLFEPFFKDNRSYVDGGFLCNYPSLYCVSEQIAHPNEILLLNMSLKTSRDIHDGSNLFEFINRLIEMVLLKLQQTPPPPATPPTPITQPIDPSADETETPPNNGENLNHFPNEIVVGKMPTVFEIINVMGSEEKRKELIEYGIELVKTSNIFGISGAVVPAFSL